MNKDTNIIAIAQACEDPKKGLRQTLQAINFTGTEAQATDGFILAITPYEVEKKGLLACEYFKTFKPNSELINFDARQVVSFNGIIKPIKELTDEFPKVEQVRKRSGDNNYLRVGLGRSVLEKILAVMKKNDDDFIELQFDKELNKPVFGKLKDIELTIMPYRLND